MSHAVTQRTEMAPPGVDGAPRAAGGAARPGISMVWATAYAAVLLVLVWSRTLHPAYLFGAATAIAVALVLARAWRPAARAMHAAAEHAAAPSKHAPGAAGRPRRRAVVVLYAAIGLLAIAVATGFLTGRRLDRIASDWERMADGRQARLTAELNERMRLVLDRGRRAASAAAVRAARPSPRGLFADLAELRAETGVAALAVFDDAGELTAWAGDHRGIFPGAVRTGGAPTVYAERPLFSYLYFAEPIEESGRRAVAAVLLQTGLPLPGGTAASVAGAFAARTAARPQFAAGPAADAAWSLVEAGDTIVHAGLDRAGQAEWRSAVALFGQRATVTLVAGALFLLALGWLRASGTGRALAAVPGRSSRRDRRGGESLNPIGDATRRGSQPGGPAPLLLAIALALAIAPLGAVLGLERLFSPAFFLLPVRGDLSLGGLAAVLLPLAALAAASSPRRLKPRRARFAIALGTLAVGIGFTGGLRLLLAATAPPLLEGGLLLWGGLQMTAVVLLTTIAGLSIPWERSDGDAASGRPVRPLLVGTGLALGLALALAVLARWQLVRQIEPWVPALWAVPFALVAIGLAPYAGRGGRVLRWAVAGCLAASAVLPHVWVAHVEARLDSAERELATLGTRADPLLDYLLRRFAVETSGRAARGEADVHLLYRAWVASGLAREAYAARITLWSPDGRPEAELGPDGLVDLTGRSAGPAGPLRDLFARSRRTGQPIVEVVHDVPGINQVLVVPLADSALVSVVVPPRRTLDGASGIAPLLGAEPGGEARLTLVPARLDDALPPPGITRWRRTEQGWRSETRVRFPEGLYHAHLELRFPSAGVRFARGMLLVALDLAVLVLLWAVGRAAGGEFPTPPGGWTGWLGSFRARVTLALFAFFLLPTVLFGAVAYRALAGEVTRAARMVAERAVRQAVGAFEAAEGDLRALAERTGEEVLYYHRGELAGASSPEALELGIYGTWMPPAVYRTLVSGEETSTAETREIGQRPYLVAYRPLPVAGTLAVPVSLTAGDSAVRQRELAHLILFAALIGGLLSLTLSVAVGRALAGPIGRLGRAATAVGSGRLDARLPENRADEFGALFGSFNRMVRRLRRARAQELRTARVLAWGEMARQVAHEIKNPLTPIKLSVQHLRRAHADRRPDFGGILETNVDQILAEIDRLTEISRVFSRYGAPAEAAGELEPVDVGHAIRDALTLYRAGDAGVEYRDKVEPGLPPARARAGELKEVLLNLLDNARTALDGSGRVEVRASRDEDGIELVVRDDGEGIAPELLPRIFDPQFSTRSAGTGLGLAIVRRLVEGWGGSVSAESEPGRGTTLRVRMRIAGEIDSPAIR